MDLGFLQSHTTPERLLGLLAFSAELIPTPEPISARELAGEFSWEKLRKDDICLNMDWILQ